MSILKTSKHAKSFTKNLFDFVKSNPKLKLSEFRTEFAKKTEFNSFNDLLNFIDLKNDEVETISFSKILNNSNFAALINDTSFGSFMFDEHLLTVVYDIQFNEYGIATDEERIQIPLVNIPNGKINGDTFTFLNDCDEEVTIKIFLPVSEKGVKLSTDIELMFIDNGKGESDAFPCTPQGRKDAFDRFDFHASLCLSNYDDYSRSDLENDFNNGELKYGDKSITVL